MEKIRSHSLTEQLRGLTEKIIQEEIGKATSGLQDLLVRRGIPEENIDVRIDTLLKRAAPDTKQQAQRAWIEEEITKRTKLFITNFKSEI